MRMGGFWGAHEGGELLFLFFYASDLSCMSSIFVAF